MASQQSNISAAFTRLVSAVNTLNGRVGGISSLTTTDKTSLVNALNEVKSTLTDIIDDTSGSTSKTWSSTKIQTQITSAITALVSGAPSAQDTLKELADQIVALAQADTGLLTFTAAQTLTTVQKLQGCTNLGIGDPAVNFVTEIESNLATGL